MLFRQNDVVDAERYFQPDRTGLRCAASVDVIRVCADQACLRMSLSESGTWALSTAGGRAGETEINRRELHEKALEILTVAQQKRIEEFRRA